MRKTKLPTVKNKHCTNCKGVIIHSYDYFNGVYKYKCGNCGQERYESGAKFSVQFKGANDL